MANKTGGDHLIHADLTRDHLLGTLVNGEWHSNGIIDFGDAMPGNLFYELGPLYLDMFSGQKPLLNSFLDGYGYQTSRDGRAVLPGHFSKAAMTSALLHRFNVFEALPHILPDLNQMQTLEQVAERLWAL